MVFLDNKKLSFNKARALPIVYYYWVEKSVLSNNFINYAQEMHSCDEFGRRFVADGLLFL